MKSVSVRRALAMSAVARLGSSVVGFVSVMVLSRLLTPMETGIFSVSAAMITLAHALREFGITAYINQERELTTERVATTFGIAMIIGGTIGVVLLAISAPAAQWYSQPGIGSTLRVLAIGFFIIPIGAPSFAALYREMRYRDLTCIGLSSAIASAVAANCLAFAGASYLSLAYANLVGLIVNIIGLVVVKAPYLFVRPSLVEWRRVTGYGAFACLSLLIQNAGRMAPDLIVGHFLGVVPVAFLSRANGMTDVFQSTMISVMQPVALSTFAAGHREGTNLKVGYVRAMALYSGVAWPFYAVLAITAFPAVRLLYGTQWDDSVSLLQILCAAGGLTALSVLAGPALNAIGQPHRLMWREAVSQGLLILAVFIAAHFNLVLVAWALVISAAVAFLAAQYHLAAVFGLGLSDVVRAIVPSAVVTLMSIVPAGAILYWLGWQDFGATATMALVGVCSAIVWTASIVLVGHPLRAEILNVLRSVVAWGEVLRPNPGGDTAE